MRFVADGMLGKLTRWLRMLGCDVKYSRVLNDKELIQIAETEHRTLLTRDLELYRQAVTRGMDAFLVEGVTGVERLARLAERFNLKLEIDITFSRCPKCNAEISPVSKSEAVGRVPETTASSYDEFWKCLGCGQIYWRGAHWKRIDRTLREARKMLGPR